jgi:signal transduction histidine kinase
MVRLLAAYVYSGVPGILPMELDRFVYGSASEGDGLPGGETPSVSIRRFVERAPTATVFMNPAGRVLFANERFWSLFDGSILDPSTAPFTMYHLSGFDESLLASIRSLLQGRAGEFSLESRSRMGPEVATHPLRIRGAAVRDERGTLVGAALTFDREDEPTHGTHVSELTPAPAPSEAWLGQMQHVFIQTMSHEIRTPLGAINGYTELLRDELGEIETRQGTPLPATIREFLSAIQDNTQKLLTLANELFDLSNIRQLPLVPVPLHDVLRPLALPIGERLAEKNVRLEMELDGDELMVLSDRKRLSQVLDILLSNAAKFTEAGYVRLITRHTGQEAIVEVADSGIGMSHAFMDMLFTPFTQEDDRLNRRYPGAGLGLALAKLFVGVMGGRIEVESEQGVGSTFRLYLPVA